MNQQREFACFVLFCEADSFIVWAYVNWTDAKPKQRRTFNRMWRAREFMKDFTVAGTPTKEK